MKQRITLWILRAIASKFFREFTLERINEVLAYLRKKAEQTETPIDDAFIDFIESVLEVTKESV